MVQRSVKFWGVACALAAAISVLSGACVAYKNGAAAPPKEDRGIRFSHELHTEQGLGCTDCHEVENRHASLPGHDVCSVCHEIDMDEPEEAACAFCHSLPGLEVRVREARLDDEVRFSHETHQEAAIDCSVCHPNPDTSSLPTTNLKPFCMDCHGETSPALNECTVCHTEVTRDTIPKFRGETRIQHDAPVVWENIHGRESRIDPAYCALCHDSQTSCDDCHQKNPPQSHTAAFRRHTHGLQATWDRQSCAACHEEDSCRKCHENTAPRSHRGGWGGITNTHCIECHYPPEKSNCTVCHEEIEHKSAMPSPHDFGLFPARCGICHPGGNPYRAPHLMNSTVRCAVCH